MAHPPPAGSSSPGPHSLGIQTVKKKSGFQITSVLPAQVSSASANNSIAEDTESYDDMDESHTEDLSSSDMLDVSVSRATDTGVPERSSSEETLNSLTLHGGETSGVTSPNEPVMHQGYMVNGVHHHHHHKTGRSVATTPTIPSTIPAAPQGPVPSGRSAEAGGSASSSDSAAGATIPSASANPATTASRFRVVKLDSNSEPFRKGRWTCTEFYEKDAPPGDVASVASAASVAHRAVESVIQSEHETTSGSSSGSTLSGGGGGGGGDVQQVYAQDAGAHLIPPPAESSSAPVRPYSVEPQSSYAPVEYSQIATNVQPLQIPSAVSPRAPPVSIGIPVSPRPLQMGINPDQPGAQLSSSSAQRDLQPLRAPLHLAGPAYVTASQLEDAQRLLLQHHTLLSLAAGGRAGLAGPTAAALGPDGAASAFAVSTGADEDR